MGWRLKQRWRELFWDVMPGIQGGCKAELADERAKLLQRNLVTFKALTCAQS